MRRLRDGTCPQGRSSGTIHDTSAHIQSEFNARCHYKSARKAGRGKERERTERRAERDRAKWFYFAMPRCLVSQKKITALESDPRLWKLFAATLLSFSCWLRQRSRLSASKKRPGREIMHAVVQNSADTRHGSVACLISQRYETREISELSTNLIKIARVWILPGRYFAPTSLFITLWRSLCVLKFYGFRLAITTFTVNVPHPWISNEYVKLSRRNKIDSSSKKLTPWTCE